ncbi:hypothetical protein [Tsuneonella mangrovi]|uniref:hypothetical protein n=1 Tax=Tsuneonella mangrovi TaxID=1982042 RepID=UPI000BA2A70E|nr:hypothetical protein [Tsuneonella mangrovi]
MNRIGLAIAALAGMSLLAGPAVAKDKVTGQQKLEKLLEGRTAGKPKDCISRFDQNDMQMIDDTALVYGRGKTIWVNVPANPENLDSSDIMVTHPWGSQLCRLDRVNMIDQTGHFYAGPVFLGKFVPYTRD